MPLANESDARSAIQTHAARMALRREDGSGVGRRYCAKRSDREGSRGWVTELGAEKLARDIGNRTERLTALGRCPSDNHCTYPCATRQCHKSPFHPRVVTRWFNHLLEVLVSEAFFAKHSTIRRHREEQRDYANAGRVFGTLEVEDSSDISPALIFDEFKSRPFTENSARAAMS